MTDDVCPNCGAICATRFCGACGQDNRRALTVRSLVTDLVDVLFNVDARIWQTVRGLTLRPGTVVRRYTEGQRARFVNPLRYAIAATAIWWLLVYTQIRGVDLSALPAQQRILLVYGQALNLGLLPVIALGTRVVFWRRPAGFVEHLCFTFFVCGHVFLWRAALATTGWLAPSWGKALNLADGIVFPLYFAWGLFCWMRGRATWLLLRVVAAIVVLHFATHFTVQAAVRWLVA